MNVLGGFPLDTVILLAGLCRMTPLAEQLHAHEIAHPRGVRPFPGFQSRLMVEMQARAIRTGEREAPCISALTVAHLWAPGQGGPTDRQDPGVH